MSLNTGDNAPVSEHGLLRAGRTFERIGWNPKKPVTDRTGNVFGVFMQHKQFYDEQLFLVAKPSDVWKGIVSTQLDHLKKLAERRIPLVIYVETEETFYWFNSLEVLLRGQGTNTRLNVEMWNFKLSLGYKFPTNATRDDIREMWEKMKARQKVAEKIEASRL